MNDIDTLRVHDLPDCLTRPGETITTVRPSCLEVHGARIKLRRLMIDNISVINGFVVRRTGTSKKECYAIGGRRFTFDGALDILEGRVSLTKQQAAPDSQPLTLVSPPMETRQPQKPKRAAKSKKKTYPVSKAQMKLPLTEAA